MKYKNHKNIIVLYDQNLSNNLFELMVAGRIDYIIGYPYEGQYYSKISDMEDVVCLPIEGMPDYLLGYVGFPKNEWGKAIIAKINPIIKSNRNTPAYHSAYEFWLDEISINRYRQYAREVYGNQPE